MRDAHKFTVVMSGNDPRRLLAILARPDFPKGVEVVTQEHSAVPCLTDTAPAKDRVRHIKLASGGMVPRFAALARKKNLRLWIGAPYYDTDTDKLYNAYGLFEDGKFVLLHSKKYLWKTEKVLIPGTSQPIFDVPEKFDGDFGNVKVLICHEAFGFWDPVWKKVRLPEARRKVPQVILLPAHWEENPPVTLDKICRTIVRRAKNAADRKLAANPRGCVLLLANHNRAAVFGPAEEGSGNAKGKCYAELRAPGWIEADLGRREFTLHPV